MRFSKAFKRSAVQMMRGADLSIKQWSAMCWRPNGKDKAVEFFGEFCNPTDLISGELSSESFIPLGTLTVDPKINPFLQSSVGAGGGFLLYPNKPNLNMLQSVYQKQK